MARYDRIAPIIAPHRQKAFPGWLVLRDLEGRERDAELARRARLRFLAVRMVRRLLRDGFDQVPAASFERQIEGVREELGHLGARDPERARLAQFLHKVSLRSPSAACEAALDMGEVTEEMGHLYAAEEFYLTGYDIAAAIDARGLETMALRLLGSVYQRGGRWEESEDAYQRAGALALQIGERREWSRAVRGIAAGYALRDNPAQAEKVLRDALQLGREWQDAAVTSSFATDLAQLALDAGDVDRAAEQAWFALSLASDDEQRSPALFALARSLRRAGLLPAAEACYELLLRSSTSTQVRFTALADQAVAAAEAGDSDLFMQRRARLLERASESTRDPRVRASLNIELARAAMHVGSPDLARDHLRDALLQTRKQGNADVTRRAESLLTALEATTVDQPYPGIQIVPGGDRIRAVAAEFEGFAHQTVSLSN
jgi:tetratricopeptide (TPR) repeat protein